MTECVQDINDPHIKYGTGFRKGSLVCYNGITRTVDKVFFYHKPRYREEMPGERYVTHLDLGGPDSYIPVSSVSLIKL